MIKKLFNKVIKKENTTTLNDHEYKNVGVTMKTSWNMSDEPIKYDNTDGFDDAGDEDDVEWQNTKMWHKLEIKRANLFAQSQKYRKPQKDITLQEIDEYIELLKKIKNIVIEQEKYSNIESSIPNTEFYDNTIMKMEQLKIKKTTK